MIGDHIRTLKAGRWNHAIDCGDETVIALAVDDAEQKRVRRSYRPEFVAGAESVEVVTHRERTFPADEVVARAYSRVADPALAAMFRDSEAFAEWCTTGRLAAAPNVAVSVPGVTPAPSPAAPAAPAPAPAPAKPRARKTSKRAAKAKAKPARAAKAARKPRPAAAKKAKARKPAKTAARAKRKKPARRTRR